MMEPKQRSYTILVFPWLAHGHISPFLELGKRLAKRNFKIYLCSTPVNLNSIKTKLSQKESNSIQLVELHLPSLPHLPPHYHTTKNLPPHLMSTLKKAFSMSAPSFYTILERLKPDLVIYDFIQTWAPTLPSSLNIPAVSFSCFPASVISCVLHLMKQGGDQDQFPFPGTYLPDQMKEKLEQLLQSASDGSNDIDKMLAALKTSTDIVLIKSFRKLEGKYIDYLENCLSKKIVAVGPLVQEPTYGDDDHRQMEMISQWLDKKGKGSTVFVSFGSEYFLSTEEREEVAYGLELSEVNFIWPIRFPAGEKMKLEEALPKGYLERVSDRCLILEDLAPQMMILKHPNVGGFVSHCGWNSTLESMKLGVPIVAIPMHLDQPVNAEVVEAVGVGIKVRRNQIGVGGLDRVEIARCIRMVVMEESGEDVRRKAKEMSEHMEGEGEEEIDEVVKELVKLCDARTC